MGQGDQADAPERIALKPHGQKSKPAASSGDNQQLKLFGLGLDNNADSASSAVHGHHDGGGHAFHYLGSASLGRWTMPPTLNRSRIKNVSEQEERAKGERRSMFLDNAPLEKTGKSAKRPAVKRTLVQPIRNHSVKSPLLAPAPISVQHHNHKSPVPLPQTVVSAKPSAVPGSRSESSARPQSTAAPSATDAGLRDDTQSGSSTASSLPPSPKLAAAELAQLTRTLLHYLACQPREIDDCLAKTKQPLDAVLYVLKKIGSHQAARKNCFQLKTESFKDLDPWNFDYSKEERDRAIRNAHVAFETLNVPKSERLRLRKPDPLNLEARPVPVTVPAMGKRKSPVQTEPAAKKLKAAVDLTAYQSVFAKTLLADHTDAGKTTEKTNAQKKKRDVPSPSLSHARNPSVSEVSVASTDRKVDSPKMGSPRNKIPGSAKPSVQKKSLFGLESRDWKEMNHTELEVYVSWLRGVKQDLKKSLDGMEQITSDVSMALIGKSKESEKMALIRTLLVRGGYEADPGLFLSKATQLKDKYAQVSLDLSRFLGWIDSLGG
ncbi:hypothetical protein HDU91_000741, partial [Kappamyces sp. JEL0680]